MSLENYRCCVMVFHVFLSSLWLTQNVTGSYEETLKANKFLEKLQNAHDYETSVRPNFQGSMLNVSTSFSLVSMDNLAVMSMDYSVDFYLHHKWRDERLSHTSKDAIDVDEELQQKIWVPDTYIVNSKESRFHKVLLNNKKIQVSLDGTVDLSLRLTTRASCQLNFKFFPWDTQRCVLIFESYSYDDKEIRYHWNRKQKERHKKELSKPGKVKELSQYTLINVGFENITNQYSLGNWSTLIAVFYLKRKNGLYLLQTMGPSLITVCISWITFVIQLDHYPARISLGITSILTMEAIQLFIESSLPQVSYLTMLDVYSATSYFFVYFAMLEYALVLMVLEKANKKKSNKTQEIIQKVKPRSLSAEMDDISQKVEETDKNELVNEAQRMSEIQISPGSRLWMRHPQIKVTTKTAYDIDKFSKIFFLVTFTVFNVTFWIYVNLMVT